MDPNVWFDDASIIHNSCRECVIDQHTKDALLRLSRAYQRAKHRNEFSAEDDDTRRFDTQLATLQQIDGHSHVIVKADASSKATKVGEIKNGTDCIIEFHDARQGAYKIHVETEHMKLIGWVRDWNVCNMRQAGPSDSQPAAHVADTAVHAERHPSNKLRKRQLSPSIQVAHHLPQAPSWMRSKAVDNKLQHSVMTPTEPGPPSAEGS